MKRVMDPPPDRCFRPIQAQSDLRGSRCISNSIKIKTVHGKFESQLPRQEHLMEPAAPEQGPSEPIDMPVEPLVVLINDRQVGCGRVR